MSKISEDGEPINKRESQHTIKIHPLSPVERLRLEGGYVSENEAKKSCAKVMGHEINYKRKRTVTKEALKQSMYLKSLKTDNRALVQRNRLREKLEAKKANINNK